MPLDLLERRLEAGPGGLSSAEARTRLLRYGHNQFETRRVQTIPIKILHGLRNPLVLVLLIAAAISAGTGEVASTGIISTILLLSVLMDAIQEHRAETAALKLRTSVGLRERVLRDGAEAILGAEELVPGDIVLLAAGDLVPADGVLIEARDFFVNEALLTGEPYPAEKQPVPEGLPGAGLSEARNAAFMGSSVVSGSAKFLICATGRASELGRIGEALRRPPPPAALARGTYEFGLFIMRLTGLLVLFTLLVNIALHRPVLESFLFALALAVGLTPELLPMIVSVTLARGALRMAKDDVIVKRLSAIHDLGSMDILCTDKTGTLTEAKIRLIRQLALSGADYDRVLDLAWLNSKFESGLRSPLDDAILLHGAQDKGAWTKIDEIPFDFERRRVSVLLEKDGARILIVKGAPEDVLGLSSRYEEPGETRPRTLDAPARQNAHALFESLSIEGFRVLGIGWRAVEPDCAHAHIADEAELTFAGFAAFLDPPKESAGATITALKQGGVAVKILTGDNEHVTRHVCGELGIPIDGVLSGAELAHLSDEALAVRAEATNIFVRVTPAQKNRVILALKRRGHVVGFLGDGINDAPSIHNADVGMSVEGAVDVAKDAADIVLLKQDLRVLESGVREGRRTFANIMKYVMMGTSSSFGNMLSMAGASLILPFLPMLPVQILLNNLLYDLSELPIPLDSVDEASMARPQHWDIKFVRDFMLVFGPISSLFDFLTFALLLLVFHAREPLFQTGWFVESLATQALVIFVIRTRANPLRSRPHRLLVVAALGIVLAGILLPYSPLGLWFGFVPPPVTLLLSLGGMLALYLVLVETAKRLFFRSRQP